MAKRPASRAVKKARRAKKEPKKENVSAKKVSLVAAKPAASRPGPVAKITEVKGASVEVKTVKAESASSRSGGEPRAARHLVQPAKPRVAARSKIKKKEAAPVEAMETAAKPAASRLRRPAKPKATEVKGASVEVNAVKSKAALSRRGSEARGAPHAVQPARSRAAAGSKIKKKEAAVSRPRRKAKRMPPYLAAELGQPVDHEGEPIGAGSALARSDEDLQAYALRLWRQMQSGGAVRRYMRAIERAGLTIDEVWTVGFTDIQSTSSTPDELRRYQQKLLFRANLLEAILSETVADLHRLPGIEPTSPDKVS
jgi:hypothetical protein